MPIGAITLADITSASWSVALDFSEGGAPGAGLGNVVQALADIHQCIAIICTTVPGEDPLRPTFGADLTRYLDLPMTAAVPGIVAAITAAINAWEPRVTLEGITAQPVVSNPGQMRINILWRINLGPGSVPIDIGGNQPQNTKVVIPR